ncbi:MAG: IPT/TIG domain-containing protein, partial [Candidatus Cyclobacteriaceae bacterium M3_2C_046]
MKRILFISCWIAFINLSVYAQEVSLFSNVTEESGLTNGFGNFYWYDYNLDGNIDLINSNLEGEINIYENNNGFFDPVNFNRPKARFDFGVINGFINVNQDNQVDLVYDGQILINNFPNFDLANIPIEGYPILIQDLNNDGLEDIITDPFDESDLYNLYYNKDNQAFIKQQTFDLGSSFGLEVLDYNKDGKKDLLVGNKIYTNFNDTYYQTHTINTGYSFLFDSEILDYNNDGEEDILFFGYNFFFRSEVLVIEYYIKIYADQNDSFEEVFSSQVDYSRLLGVADLTNDGNPEVVLFRRNDISQTDVYTISSDSLIFISNLSQDFENHLRSEFYDYDQDGDLDILLDDELYRNDINQLNQPPSVPQNLASGVNNNQVNLTWDRSTDAETADASIAYNLILRRDAFSVVHPYADNEGAKARSFTPNTGLNNFFSFQNLPVGAYVWQVQAMDQGLNTSSFSQPDTFVITNGKLEVLQYENVEEFDISFNEKRNEFVITISDGSGIYTQTINGNTFQKTSPYKKVSNLSNATQINSLVNEQNNETHLVYQQNNLFRFQEINQNLTTTIQDSITSEPSDHIASLLGSIYKNDQLMLFYLTMSPPVEGATVDIFLKIVQQPLSGTNAVSSIKSLKVGSYQLNPGTTLTQKPEFEGELNQLDDQHVSVVWSLNTEIQYNPTEPLSAGLKLLTLNTDQLTITDDLTISPADSLAEYIQPKIAYNTYNPEIYVSWIKRLVDRNGTSVDPFDYSEVFGKQVILSNDFSSFSGSSPDMQMSQSNIQGPTKQGVTYQEVFHAPDKNEYFVLWENNSLSEGSNSLGDINTLNIDPFNLAQNNPLDSAFVNLSASQPFVKYNPLDKSYLLLWYHNLSKKAVTITKYIPPKDPRIQLQSIDPPEAYAGEKVIIYGQNFGKTPFLNQVFFGGVPAQVDTVFFDRERLQVTVPPGLTNLDVPVFVSFDGLGESSQDNFLFGPKIPPEILNVSMPNPSTCNEVTIRGQFYRRDPDSLSIHFNQVKVSDEDIVEASESVIVTKIPLGVHGPATITIQTDQKEIQSTDKYQIFLGSDIKKTDGDKVIELIPDFSTQATLGLNIYNECSLQEIELYYRGITSEEPWKTISGITNFNQIAPNYFQVELDDQNFDELGLEYYFKLEDLSGQIIYSDTNKIYRKYLGRDKTNNLSDSISFF